MFCVSQTFMYIVVLSVGLCLHLSGLQHHKLEWLIWKHFRSQLRSQFPLEDVLWSITKDYPITMPCSVFQKSRTARVPEYLFEESTIFGQNKYWYVDKIQGMFSKKLKVSLNYYTRVYERSLFSVSVKKGEKEARKEN